MVRNRILFLIVISVGLVACDSASEAPNDSGTGGETGGLMCPATVPEPRNQQLPCCFRASNASRPNDVMLRIVGLGLTAPSTLANPLFGGVVNTATVGESFNWLIRIQSSGSGAATVTTGYGNRAANGTFSFSNGDAPTSGGSATRWDPVTLTGTLTGEQLSTTPSTSLVRLPIFNPQMPTEQTSELPLSGVEVTEMNLTENRTCVGTFSGGNVFTTNAARLRAYVLATDAMQTVIVVSATLRITLCQAINGDFNPLGDAGTATNYCTTTPQTGWATKPNSLCTGGVCMTNPPGTTAVCDPSTTCNAWLLEAGFAAHGVEITGTMPMTDAGVSEGGVTDAGVRDGSSDSSTPDSSTPSDAGVRDSSSPGDATPADATAAG